MEILAPPLVSLEPLGLNLAHGGKGFLRAFLAGQTPLNIQWFKNDKPIPRFSGTELRFTNAGALDDGTFYLTVSDRYGTTTSAIAQVTVQARPVIVSLPSQLVVEPGKAFRLEARGAGAGPLSAFWRKDGARLQEGLSQAWNVASASRSDESKRSKNASGNTT